ncbi:MAG: hypothetical protein DWQ42_19545 [Planctomycetota bacterium]|nr:MAG: hypothetical protein DWQ42_19545 [Planctomycetota bacterium]REK37509.1 MAG: hypothetical protein DWQ46_22025 [Planctomycetota bacterium]
MLMAATMLPAISGCFGSPPAALKPVASPDGTWVVTPSVNRSKADRTTYLCIAFEVTDAAGNPLHQVQSNANDRMKWALGWYDNDTIVLASSDVGTSAWQLTANGSISQLPDSLPAEITAHAQRLTDAKYGP